MAATRGLSGFGSWAQGPGSGVVVPGLRCAAEVGSSGSGIEPSYPALGHQGNTWIDELEIFLILFLKVTLHLWLLQNTGYIPRVV